MVFEEKKSSPKKELPYKGLWGVNWSVASPIQREGVDFEFNLWCLGKIVPKIEITPIIQVGFFRGEYLVGHHTMRQGRKHVNAHCDSSFWHVDL